MEEGRWKMCIRWMMFDGRRKSFMMEDVYKMDDV